MRELRSENQWAQEIKHILAPNNTEGIRIPIEKDPSFFISVM